MPPSTVEFLREKKPLSFAALVGKTGLEMDEVWEWKRACGAHVYPI